MTVSLCCIVRSKIVWKRERGTRVSVNRKKLPTHTQQQRRKEKKTPPEREDDYVTDRAPPCVFLLFSLKSLCAGYWAIGKKEKENFFPNIHTARFINASFCIQWKTKKTNRYIYKILERRGYVLLVAFCQVWESGIPNAR